MKTMVCERGNGDEAELGGGVETRVAADCFAVIRAQTLEAELLTADHHEFAMSQQQDACRIRFIR